MMYGEGVNNVFEAHNLFPTMLHISDLILYNFYNLNTVSCMDLMQQMVLPCELNQGYCVYILFLCYNIYKTLFTTSLLYNLGALTLVPVTLKFYLNWFHLYRVCCINTVV